jgi:Mn-dependent DtxR family transcriptional regulator
LIDILAIIYQLESKNTEKQVANLEELFNQNPAKASQMLDSLWVTLP